VTEKGGVVLFDGATEFAGLRAVAWAAWHWPALRRELVGSTGYLAHRMWFALPWTVGLVTWWEDAPSAYRFAHGPAHLRFWRWAAAPGHTRGGWLAQYRYAEGGALWGNGVRPVVARLGRHVGAPSHGPARPPRDPGG
jgi:fumigallin biosynthesis monooxygenase-like protein